MPRFKVGELIRHKHHDKKDYDTRPKGVCMILEIIPPTQNAYVVSEGEGSGGYKLLMPEGSGFTNEDDENSNPTWSGSYIDNDYEEVE